ncbi:orotate phosphoribosyltransferase [Candidatus Kapabacteria bacterium]|nr:orotate phosphoribosyltransferase [Candidatus Kapabacteria bacterium]
MNRDQLCLEIFNSAHITGEFKLRSGVVSNEYFDKYQFESIPQLLNNIAIHITEIVSKLDYDILAPLEMGGIPISTALALKVDKIQCFVRKKAKEYGTAKLAEGPNIDGKKLLIVEDVVTSGGQIILSTNDLRKQGAIITDAVCVIDREAGGKEKLTEIGVTLHPLFTMTELKAISQL